MDKIKILLGIAVFLAILLLLIPNRSTRADNLQSPTKIFASLVNQPRSPIIYNEVNLLPTGFGNTISNTDNLIGTGGSSTYRVVAIDDQIFVGQPSISLEAVK